MTFEDIKKLDDEYVMHTYGRYQLAIDHGKSATCYAPDGKAYIDFTSGIGVNVLGLFPAGHSIYTNYEFQSTIGNIDMVSGYLSLVVPLLLVLLAVGRYSVGAV